MDAQNCTNGGSAAKTARPLFSGNTCWALAGERRWILVLKQNGDSNNETIAKKIFCLNE